MGGNYGRQSSNQRSRTKTRDYTPGEFKGGFRQNVADQATNFMNTGGQSFGDYAGGYRQPAPQPVNTAQFFTPGQGLKEQMGGMSTTAARDILANPFGGGGRTVGPQTGTNFSNAPIDNQRMLQDMQARQDRSTAKKTMHEQLLQSGMQSGLSLQDAMAQAQSAVSEKFPTLDPIQTSDYASGPEMQGAPQQYGNAPAVQGFGGGPQGGGQFDPYVAQMTPGEQYGLGQVQGQAYGAPLDQPSTELLGNTIGGQYLGPEGVDQAIAGANLGETIGGKYLSPESNPYLQSTVDSALRRSNESLMDQFEQIRQADQGAFARAGHHLNASSPFAAARAEAATGAQRALGNATSDITAQILGGNYQAERGRQLAAQGQYAGLQGQQYGQERAMQMGATDQATQQAQARLMNAMRGLESAGLPRMIKDVGIERGLQDFARRMGAMQGALNLGGQLASPTLGSTSKSKGTSSGFQMGGGLLTS